VVPICFHGIHSSSLNSKVQGNFTFLHPQYGSDADFPLSVSIYLSAEPNSKLCSNHQSALSCIQNALYCMHVTCISGAVDSRLAQFPWRCCSTGHGAKREMLGIAEDGVGFQSLLAAASSERSGLNGRLVVYRRTFTSSLTVACVVSSECSCQWSAW
jgi:hypothetical protein